MYGLTLKQGENFLRLALAQAVMLFFLLLNFTTLPFLDGIKPYFFLMALYYWAIYRPTLVPFYYCFAAGFFIDVLGGTPLGIHPLTYVLVRWLVSNQRRFLMGQPYMAIWAVFALIAALSALLQWSLFGIASGHWEKPAPAMISAGLTVFLFPFVTLLLVRIHRVLPVASRTMPRVK